MAQQRLSRKIEIGDGFGVDKGVLPLTLRPMKTS